MKKLGVLVLASTFAFTNVSGAFAGGNKITPLKVHKSTQDSLGLGGLGSGAGLAIVLIGGLVILAAALGSSTSGT